MFFHVKISLTLLLYIKITDESSHSHSRQRIKNTIETVKIGNIISTMGVMVVMQGMQISLWQKRV